MKIQRLNLLVIKPTQPKRIDLPSPLRLVTVVGLESAVVIQLTPKLTAKVVCRVLSAMNFSCIPAAALLALVLAVACNQAADSGHRVANGQPACPAA